VNLATNKIPPDYTLYYVIGPIGLISAALFLSLTIYFIRKRKKQQQNQKELDKGLNKSDRVINKSIK